MSTKRERQVVGYIMFDRIDIENANALSGNLVYGIPAITGVKGAFHAMSRKILTGKNTAGMKVSLRGVMVACHEYNILASRSESYKNYRFMQQKMSVVSKGDLAKQKKGVPPSIIEQAYCSVKMTFVVEVVCDRELTDQEKILLELEAYKLIQQNRMAGGSVRPFKDRERVSFIEYENLNDASYKFSNSHVLIDATDCLVELIDENKDMTAIDIIVGVGTTKVEPVESKDGKHINWKASRLGSNLGWLVPITNGYQGISQKFSAGELENARPSSLGDVESRYVEAVYTLGKWVNPHVLRLNDGIRGAFWCYDYQPENSLYLVKTNTETKKGSNKNV